MDISHSKLGSMSTYVTTRVWQQISIIMHHVSMHLWGALLMNGKTDLGAWYTIVCCFHSSFQLTTKHCCGSKITAGKGAYPFLPCHHRPIRQEICLCDLFSHGIYILDIIAQYSVQHYSFLLSSSSTYAMAYCLLFCKAFQMSHQWPSGRCVAVLCDFSAFCSLWLIEGPVSVTSYLLLICAL